MHHNLRSCKRLGGVAKLAYLGYNLSLGLGHLEIAGVRTGRWHEQAQGDRDPALAG